MSRTRTSIGIISYDPVRVSITLTRPICSEQARYHEWVKTNATHYKTTQHKVDDIVRFETLLCELDSFAKIDELIAFAEMEQDVFIIDRAFNKSVTAVRTPAGDIFAVVLDWEDDNSVLKL